MRSFQPSIMIGSYHWDEERLPRDEFKMRRRALDQAMETRDWKAVLIYGDAREHAALAYYTNFIPRLRWAAAILPRDGEPLLLCSNSSRDIPSMRPMTWIPDIRSGWEWTKHVDPYLTKLDRGMPGTLGAIGLDLMTPALRGQLGRSLGNRWGLVSAEDLFAHDRTLRPREMTLARESARRTTDAAQIMLKTWRDGKSVAQAALAAERQARLAAAQDVRILVSGDGGRSLAPNLEVAAAPNDILFCYLAVKFAGFWSELFVSGARNSYAALDRSRAGLNAALAALRPGVEAGTVHAAAASALAPAAAHPVLSDSIGRRIGLSLDEGCQFRAGSHEKLTPGIYTLHVGAMDGVGAAVSAMIALGETGPAVLCLTP
jgi:Xaa-Pro aminopeptidase